MYIKDIYNIFKGYKYSIIIIRDINIVPLYYIFIINVFIMLSIINADRRTILLYFEIVLSLNSPPIATFVLITVY